MALDYFALFLVFFVVIFLFYGIIVLHEIPYEIAKHRNHPHQDAIHVAGWVSLFTLHVIWPFLWIWSTLYREDRGWGFVKVSCVFPGKFSHDNFVTKGWDAGAGADAVAGKDAESLALRLPDGTRVHKLNDKGVMLSATLTGTKYWQSEELNAGIK